MRRFARYARAMSKPPPALAGLQSAREVDLVEAERAAAAGEEALLAAERAAVAARHTLEAHCRRMELHRSDGARALSGGAMTAGDAAALESWASRARATHDALEAASTWREHSARIVAWAAFPMHAAGHYDGLVAMYHDQGLGPFKLMHMHDGVNMTLGLPFVRTSPDHGTARDISGQGIADPSSMFEAVILARTLGTSGVLAAPLS